MSQYTYTQVPQDAWETLARNAGMLVDSFTPEGRVIGNQIAATTGGVSVSCTPSFVDQGEDVDNCPKNTMELKDIESYECKMSGTFVTIKKDSLKMLIPAATESGGKLSPGMKLETSNFQTLYYVVDYGKGGYIAVELLNALSTAGVSIQTTDKGKTKFAFEFTGHSSLADQDTVPMNFYIESEAAGVGG